MTQPDPIVPAAAFWIDSSFTDALAICAASERVNRRVLTGGAIVLEIIPNFAARGIATLILAREVIARIVAYGTQDLSGVFGDDGTTIGPPHFAYDDAAGFGGADAGNALAALEYNVANPTLIQIDPKLACSGTTAGLYSSWGLSGVPRFVVGVVAAQVPTMITPTPPTALGTRLRTVVAAQSTLDATIDSGLAATCAANLATERARVLAQIQALHPERSYS